MKKDERIAKLTKHRAALEKIHDDIYDDFNLSGLEMVVKSDGSIKYRHRENYDLDADIARKITRDLTYIFDLIDEELEFIRQEEDAA